MRTFAFISRKWLLFLNLTSLVGCASLRDTTQTLPVACMSERCEVQVMGTDQKIQAPGTLKVQRQQHLQLKFSEGSTSKVQNLEGHLRWKESIFANAVFLALGPGAALYTALGWTIDYFTGNIWELPTPEVESLEITQKKILPRRLVIAPPQAPSQLESDEAVKVLTKILQTTYPHAHHSLPEEYFLDFEKSGWSYSETPTKEWQKYELYEKMGTEFIVTSQITRSQDHKMDKRSFVTTYKMSFVDSCCSLIRSISNRSMIIKKPRSGSNQKLLI